MTIEYEIFFVLFCGFLAPTIINHAATTYYSAIVGFSSSSSGGKWQKGTQFWRLQIHKSLLVFIPPGDGENLIICCVVHLPFGYISFTRILIYTIYIFTTKKFPFKQFFPYFIKTKIALIEFFCAYFPFFRSLLTKICLVNVNFL